VKLNLKGLSISAGLALLGAFLISWATKGSPSAALAELGPVLFPVLIGWASGAPVRPTVDLDGDGKPDAGTFPRGF